MMEEDTRFGGTAGRGAGTGRLHGIEGVPEQETSRRGEEDWEERLHWTAAIRFMEALGGEEAVGKFVTGMLGGRTRR